MQAQHWDQQSLSDKPPDQEPSEPLRQRLYELDLLRLIAAMSVVFYHYTFNGFQAGVSPVEFTTLGEVSKYGYLGVDLFFLMSGFVILMTATRAKARGFAISRLARLFPSIIVCVTATTLAGFAIGGPRFHVGLNQYLMNVFMFSEYAETSYVDGVYWSLLVEIRFYVLVGVILAAGAIHRVQGLLMGWLVLAAVYFVADFPGPLPYLLILNWSPYFIAGALFFLIRRDGPSPKLLAMIVATYALSILHSIEVIEHKNTGLSVLVVAVIILGFYLTLLLISLNKLTIMRVRRFAPMGAMTYPLYLLHQNIGFMLFRRFEGSINSSALLISVILAMLGLALAFSHRIEGSMSHAIKDYFHDDSSPVGESDRLEHSLGSHRPTPGAARSQTKIDQMAEESQTLSEVGL